MYPFTEEDIIKSRESLRKYMSYHTQNSTRHEAWIVGTSGAHNIEYHGVLYVCPICSNELYSMLIEGDNAYTNYDLPSRCTEYDAKSFRNQSKLT